MQLCPPFNKFSGEEEPNSARELLTVWEVQGSREAFPGA